MILDTRLSYRRRLEEVCPGDHVGNGGEEINAEHGRSGDCQTALISDGGVQQTLLCVGPV